VALLSPKRYYQLPALEGNTRRWVVGDIHGCLLSFRYAIEKVMEVKKTDQLILLGDYIDRGPDSRGVLDYIMGLQEQGYNVHPILGNHEYNLLVELENPGSQSFRDHISLMKAESMLDMTGTVPEKYLAWMFNLPHYVLSEDALFVHAGFDFGSPDRFVPSTKHFELRHFTYHKEAAGGRRVYHGHQPTPSGQIEQAFAQRAPIIPLDAGCVYAFSRPKKAIANGHGYLACLETTRWRLIMVPNQEFLMKGRA
jgi:serine/threonine protein phosphatase 1